MKMFFHLVENYKVLQTVSLPERPSRNLKAITEKMMNLYRHRHPHILEVIYINNGNRYQIYKTLFLTKNTE